MATDIAIRELTEHLTALRSELERLERSDSSGDQVGHVLRHVLVDRLTDSARDSLGWVRRSRTAAVKARRVSDSTGDPVAIRRYLSRCQADLAKGRSALGDVLSRRFTSNLADLTKRHPRWSEWTSEARRNLARTRMAANAVKESILKCWQELAGQAAPQIVIRNVAIGKQSLPGRRTKTRRDAQD